MSQFATKCNNYDQYKSNLSCSQNLIERVPWPDASPLSKTVRFATTTTATTVQQSFMLARHRYGCSYKRYTYDSVYCTFFSWFS